MGWVDVTSGMVRKGSPEGAPEGLILNQAMVFSILSIRGKMPESHRIE